ncbi:transporter substrate-binding domain-containing protein [Microvirga sp. TS319]|uniref:transporter substrate-binding domain-containing protein n=1 Tax=Microvirga sp. TS319 TaxID=3241165 RepID=UPI00351A5909
MSKKTTLWLAACAALMIAPAVEAQTKWTKVKIATEGAYEPWNFTRPGGKLDGFEIDLANDLCARMKVECEIVAQDWDGIIPALQAKKYDAIMAGMSKTSERLKAIGFSRPYAKPPNGFAVVKTSPLAKLPHANTLLDISANEEKATAAIEEMKALLKGKTVGVQTSSTNSAFAEKYFRGLVDIREYKTTDQHDLDLAAGRIDLVFETVIAMNASLAKPEMADLVQAGPSFVGGLLGDGVAVGVRHADMDLRDLFDSAIQAAIADGTVRKLSEKWFNTDVSPKN